jgi:hypothetical protein
VIRHEAVCELRDGWHAAFIGLLARGIVPARDRRVSEPLFRGIAAM